MSNYAEARFHMVEGQIRPNKVIDLALVDSLMSVPREQFVSKAARGIAYVDEDIPVGQGRYLMQPLVLARLIQDAQVRKHDVVLDIGCGTGYSTAVLANMAATVVGLESDKTLAAQATGTLRDLGVDNAVVIEGDLAQGYAAQAPYDVIVFNGAVAEVPDAILTQLAEGGRLVAVIAGGDGRVGHARLFQRLGGVASSRTLFETVVPVVPGFERKPQFVF